jgi:hypothetical protein
VKEKYLMSATVWLVLTVLGFVTLRSMVYMRHATLKAIAIRFAAFAFLGAGTVGAAGWLGHAMTSVIGAVNRIGAQAGAAAIGTGAVWIAWALMAGAWILTLLPERMFGRDIPDWLSMSGLVLPALAVTIPGPFGQLIRAVTTAVGGLMVAGAHAAVGA